MVRGVAVAWAAIGLVSGCSRANPGFEPNGGDGGTLSAPGDGSSGVGATSVVSSTTTGGDDGDVDDDGTIDTGGFDDDDAGSDEPADSGVRTCDWQDDNLVIDIVTFEDSVEPVCAGGSGANLRQFTGDMGVTAAAIEMELCGECPCTTPQGPLSLQHDADFELPAYAGCGHLMLWAEWDSILGCRWVGFAVLNEDEYPLSGVTSSLKSPFGEPWVSSLEPRELCGEALACGKSDRHPGEYALVINGAEVEVGAPPTDLTLGWGAGQGIPASVEAHAAAFSEMCEQSVLWTFETGK